MTRGGGIGTDCSSQNQKCNVYQLWYKSTDYNGDILAATAWALSKTQTCPTLSLAKTKDIRVKSSER